MSAVQWESLDESRPQAGVRVRATHGMGFTASRYELDAGARFPLHRHVDEKLLVVLAGEVTFAVGSETVTLDPGDSLVVGSNVPHGASAGPVGACFIAVAVPRRTGPGAIEYL